MIASTLPKELADRSLPLPNVYFITVTHVQQGVHSLYLAADDSRAAIKKLGNYCAEHLGFRPYRTTTDIKLRRFLLGDYLDNPQGLQLAAELAELMGERSTLESLHRRLADVQSLLQQSHQAEAIDHDALADQLAQELRQLEARQA